MEINEKRNWKIYFDWIKGKDYDVLAKEYNLSSATIKEICTSKVPPNIRQTHWQTANQYKKWREWKRTKLNENDNMPDNDINPIKPLITINQPIIKDNPRLNKVFYDISIFDKKQIEIFQKRCFSKEDIFIYINKYFFNDWEQIKIKASVI